MHAINYEPGAQPNTQKTITLGELFTAYMDNHAKLHCKRWRDSERMFACYLKDWAPRDAASLRRFDFQRLHTELGERRGKTIANRVMQLLRTVYNRGLDWELINGPNPLSGLKLFRLKSRERFLDADELKRWAEAVDLLRSQTTRDFLWMCLLCGARRSNIAAMRWEEVDLERGVWRIPDTKNGDSQTLPLTALAAGVLRRRQKTADGPWVFPSTRSPSGHLTKPEKAWREVRRNANLQDARIHDLRRTLASFEAMTGANMLVIAKTLNHRDLKSVATYGRLQIEPVRQAMETATLEMIGGDIAALASAEMENQEWMTEQEVADLSGISVYTMRRLASSRLGPPSRKFGNRIRYQRANVERWLCATAQGVSSDG